MDAIIDLSKRLNKASEKKYYNPYDLFDWPASIDSTHWCFSPELMSCHETDIAAGMDEQQLKKLSFWESVNFFSLNIHGEKYLVGNMVRYLYLNWPADISEYLHHFIDEENKHMTLFGSYCSRYAKVYPDKKMVFASERERSQEDLLFFVRMTIFEELVDYFNVKMGNDDRLDPLVRQINLNHHRDEARHLMFGRKIIQYLMDTHWSRWSSEDQQALRDYIRGYFQMTWRQYYNPTMYEDAGLEGGYDIYTTLWAHPKAIDARASASAACVDFLKDVNLVEGSGEDCYAG